MSEPSVSAPDGRAADARAPEGGLARFPRGLFQPEGSFRFSVDALLLAEFAAAAAPPAARILDLGAGCGVVGLDLLRRLPDSTAVGLEMRDELVQAARANAALLGFSERYEALSGTVQSGAFAPGAFDLAVANPPWRERGRGRLPAAEARAEALFGPPGTLAAFCRAAVRSLAPGGRFCLILPADRRDELADILRRADLRPVRLRPVVSRPGKPARALLAEAVLF